MRSRLSLRRHACVRPHRTRRSGAHGHPNPHEGEGAGRPADSPPRVVAIELMLHLHRADRADALVGALSGLLAEVPADPFAPDLVAVPTRGMERWLTQQMSARLGAQAGRADGICA